MTNMMNQKTYHYNVPKILVYIIHIVVGIYLAYLGYTLTQGKKIPNYAKIILITLGAVVILYQSWLWIKFPKDNYAYDVPGWLLHLTHVLIGIYLIVLALLKKPGPILGAVTLILGAVQSLYMLHLWVLH